MRTAAPGHPLSGHGVLSFEMIGEHGALVPAANWLPRFTGSWQLQPLELKEAQSPAVLDLSKGVYRMQFQTRRSGIMIDRLMLTPNPNEGP